MLKELALTDDIARQYVLDNYEASELSENFVEETTHLDITHLTDVNKDHLNTLISKVETKNLNNTVAYATLISEDVMATQELVDAIAQELKAQLPEEEGDVDLVKLNVILEQVNKLDGTLYTEESYEALMTLTHEVEAYIEAGVLEQEVIDTYYERLMELYDKLELIPTVDPKEVEDTEKDRVEVPHTGISQSSLVPITLLVFGIGLLSFTGVKRKARSK